MTGLPPFADVFSALWEREAFPWQTMLAERTAARQWPRALDLPTAAGKTACIDIALFALAIQADRLVKDRTAPRRIWFVVDRRIVVDEAYERAHTIAEKLATAKEGPLRVLADRLRQLAGTDRPLAVARLRGGVFRDEGWARLPSQPAVITSTVDQIGSRLLFRGYGRSHLAAPILAGIAANDSLILLDEAHCAVPFLQTLRAIEGYRGVAWAERPLSSPFAFVVMSATPPPGLPEDEVFPGALREAALDHSVLRQRLRVSKPAALVQVKTKAAARRDAPDPLVTESVRRVRGWLGEGLLRIAVMVNRVATAGLVADALRAEIGEQSEVVLLTGRLRPYERDHIVAQCKRFLRVRDPDTPLRPLVLVTTQCLEVGADFNFDGLVTEAASLDALRQRFGRLDRTGAAGRSRAVVLVRDHDTNLDESKPDPVYGTAIAATWRVFQEKAKLTTAAGSDAPVVDFGVEALRSALDDVEDLAPLLAPTADAPVLLPAHLDMLCQTAPPPYPDPDVQQYLHGVGRGSPEVHVVWRADLGEDQGAWVEAVAACRPVGGEMLAAPLWRVRDWLGRVRDGDDDTDVEGALGASDADPRAVRSCVVWRGGGRSKVVQRSEEIAAGDVVVVPAAYGMGELARPGGVEGVGRGQLDLWERVLEGSGRPAAVRLQRALVEPWLQCEPLRELVELAEAPSVDRQQLVDVVDAVIAHVADTHGEAQPPSWWLELLRASRSGRVERHPAGGLVLVARQSAGCADEPDMFADDDDLTSVGAGAQSLDDHSTLVRDTVDKLAARCLPDELHALMVEAAFWHDCGKLDERFQNLLWQGDRIAPLVARWALAKSSRIPASSAERLALREASGLPESFRHEMLSVQIAEVHVAASMEPRRAELFLHLLASHHGHARPLAPICEDTDPPSVQGRLGATPVALSGDERRLWTAHRADSGVTDRFWSVTRRYGWWGLAYLEAILRLGDWYASALRRTSAADTEEAT